MTAWTSPCVHFVMACATTGVWVRCAHWPELHTCLTMEPLSSLLFSCLCGVTIHTLMHIPVTAYAVSFNTATPVDRQTFNKHLDFLIQLSVYPDIHFKIWSYLFCKKTGLFNFLNTFTFRICLWINFLPK